MVRTRKENGRKQITREKNRIGTKRYMKEMEQIKKNGWMG